MLPQEQYLRAIALSSAALGAAIKIPTERIAQHVGSALAHETEAKKDRVAAQREFEQNIHYYYEVKQRLLNPGYRKDVDGGKDRTPEENEKNFGAPDWASFNEKCAAYSLQHANRMLKEFAKANGLLADDSSNIDNDKSKEVEAGEPQSRRTADQTAQKRYEHIASAAMDIAKRNPDGEVERQILAAAEYVPAPLMPVPSDVYTDVLSFITMIASSVSDEAVRADAKRLVGKMLLHCPKPDPAEILTEATAEEKRKRGKRLADKNGRALGSTGYNPPPPGTSEHVHWSEPMSNDSTSESGSDAEPAHTEAGMASATADESEPEVNSGHANAVEPHTYTQENTETGKVVVLGLQQETATVPSTCENHSSTATYDDRPALLVAEQAGRMDARSEEHTAEATNVLHADASESKNTTQLDSDDARPAADISIEDSQEYDGYEDEEEEEEEDDDDDEEEEPDCAGHSRSPCSSDDWIHCDECHKMLCVVHGSSNTVEHPGYPNMVPTFLCDDCSEEAECRGDIQKTDDGYEYVDLDASA